MGEYLGPNFAIPPDEEIVGVVTRKRPIATIPGSLFKEQVISKERLLFMARERAKGRDYNDDTSDIWDPYDPNILSMAEELRDKGILNNSARRRLALKDAEALFREGALLPNHISIAMAGELFASLDQSLVIAQQAA